MIGQKNVTHLVMGKDLALLASGTRASLATGQVGVFKEGSQAPTTSGLQAGEAFTISFKDADGQIITTPVVKYSNIIRKSATAYAAPTQKKVYVGYNGSTGSITVNNSDEYILNAILKDNTSALNSYPPYEKADFGSDSAATEKEIAEGLIASALVNFTNLQKPDKVTMVQPGLICSAAVTATNTFAGAVTVVKGTNAVTITETTGGDNAGVYGSTPADLAVGDYIRVGGVGAGTALTNQVYKVTALSGAKTTSIVATLDRPVLEASGTYAAATSDTEVIPSATAANVATHWGLSFTGVKLPFKPGLFKYQVIDFEIILNEAFGATLKTVSTKATKGTGSYEEIAEIESFLKYNRGEVYRVASYPVSRTLNATVDKTYDIIVFDYMSNNAQTLDHKVEQYGSVMIVTEDESSQTLHTSLKTVLGIS